MSNLYHSRIVLVTTSALLIVMKFDMWVEMVPLFERCCDKLVEYWKKTLDVNGAAVLPAEADISRTVGPYVAEKTPCLS